MLSPHDTDTGFVMLSLERSEGFGTRARDPEIGA